MASAGRPRPLAGGSALRLKLLYGSQSLEQTRDRLASRERRTCRGVGAPTRARETGVPWAPEGARHLHLGRVCSAWQRAREAGLVMKDALPAAWSPRVAQTAWAHWSLTAPRESVPGFTVWAVRVQHELPQVTNTRSEVLHGSPATCKQRLRVLGRELALSEPTSTPPETATQAGHRHPPPPAEGWQSTHTETATPGARLRDREHKLRREDLYVRCVSKGGARGCWVRIRGLDHNCCSLSRLQTGPRGSGPAAWASGRGAPRSVPGRTRGGLRVAARSPRIPHGGRGPGTRQAGDLPGKTAPQR